MHSKVCPQLAGGKRCHSKACFCRLIPAGETGQSHQLQRRSGCPLARPSPHSRIPQELLHFSCSFALRPPHSPGVVPVTNIHPRAGSGIPNPVFGCWVTHTVPSSPWWCHWHTSPSNCSRGCEGYVKDIWVLQPAQKNEPLPWEGGGLLVLSTRARTHSSLPHFSKGVRDRDPSHTPRADRKGVIPEEHCF